MGKWFWWIGMVFFILTPFQTAFAQAKNGFGLSLISSYHYNDYYVVSGPLTGDGVIYETSGGGGGLDYQWALNNRLSLSLFINSTGEGSLSYAGESVSPGFLRAGYDAVGLQLKGWFPMGSSVALNIGFHVGQYSQTIELSSVNSVYSGPGSGVVLGLEWEGGFLISLQTETSFLEYVDKDNGIRRIDSSGGSVSLGYRWK